MSAWLVEWGVPIVLTPLGMWIAWKVLRARERQEDYRSLVRAYERAVDRGDEAEAKRLREVEGHRAE